MVRGLGLHLRDAVEIPDPRGCLEEILHLLDTFHAGRRVTVEPYDENRVAFLGADHRAVPLEPLLDDEARRLAADPQESIIRRHVPDASLEFRFFSDPALREPKKLLRLIRILTARGIVEL